MDLGAFAAKPPAALCRLALFWGGGSLYPEGLFRITITAVRPIGCQSAMAAGQVLWECDTSIMRGYLFALSRKLPNLLWGVRGDLFP